MIRAVDHTKAVVLSGGGAYGAYEIGVMKALFTGESPSTGHDYLNPGILTGTSVGAYNAAFIVSRPDEDICAIMTALESVWLNQLAERSGSCGNGVFRFRANPFRYANASCFASNPFLPLNELADDSTFFARDFFTRAVNFVASAGTLSGRALELVDFTSLVTAAPFRILISKLISLEGIRRADRILRVEATNWETGQLKTFGNLDMTDDQGYEIIMGSASIPGVFRPHYIAGEPYVDGGLLMNTPLRCAIQAGDTTLHVIYMDPNVKNIPLQTLQSSIDVLDRVLVITSASKLGEDIETAAWINEGLEVIERAARGNSLSDGDINTFVRVASQLYQKTRLGKPYRKLTVHRYNPHDDLGGGTLGLLNFNIDRMTALIDRGFRDALAHDCGESNCIIPL